MLGTGARGIARSTTGAICVEHAFDWDQCAYRSRWLIIRSSEPEGLSMSDLQQTNNPQRKEPLGIADYAFVAFIIIITANAVLLTLIQIYLQNPR